MTLTVPLSKLRHSLTNVRVTETDVDIDGLAASIAHHGLLQNLVVSEADEDGQTVYLVHAGGRRLRALQQLAANGMIAAAHPVGVVMIADRNAREASLQENVQKLAMNPADEVEAYACVVDDLRNGLQDEGEIIAAVARRFGVTVRHVERRLRLAGLADPILDALRDRTITLDVAEAYASHPDQLEQRKVFEAQERSPYSKHIPAAIRDALAGRVYPEGHRAVRYIGLDAYFAAGGRTDRDLFMGDADRVTLIDRLLVDRLVREKAAAEGDRYAAEGGWAGVAIKPWNKPEWTNAPCPTGFARAWGLTPADSPAEERADIVVSLEISAEGELIASAHGHFRRLETSDQTASALARDWAAEHAARLRAERLATHQANLAVAPMLGGGTRLRPVDDFDSYVEPIVETDDGKVLVAVYLELTAEEYAAHAAAAEAALAAEEAAEEAADRAADGSDGTDDADFDAPDDAEGDDDERRVDGTEDSFAAELDEAA